MSNQINQQCICGRQSKGSLCDWATYDPILCQFNNNTSQPLYVCEKCAYWRCRICKRSLCKNCFFDIKKTDSSHDYTLDTRGICNMCKPIVNT